MQLNRLMLRATGLVAALAMGASSTARADFNVTNICGGASFSTCLSAQLSWDAATQVATLTLTNNGTYGEVFKTIGLTNLPAGFQITSTTLPAGWTMGGSNNLSGDGIVQLTAEVNAANPQPKNGLQVGQSLTFIFDFSGLTSEQLAQIGVGVQAISGPGGCSNKIQINSSGAITNSPTGGVYTGCGASTVPEPATVGLVVTGLAGLGGAGLLRRRRHTA